jgi:Flp pilus assembly protein TadG
MPASISSRRRGALTLESAFVLPVLFFLLVAVVVGGYGIFRYQEVALLAREGSRYASVHGGQYAQETGNAAATSTDVCNAILPYAASLDTSKLRCDVTWNSSNMPTSATSDYEKATGNTVTVTVTYQWFPEWIIAGPITLSSTSTVPMAY